MDKDKRQALLQCRVTITGILNVFKVTDYLYYKSVILPSEYEGLLEERVS